MGFIDPWHEWCDNKVEEIREDDNHPCLKAFGYGMIRGIPDSLAIVGIMAIVKATQNLLTGNGWRV